MQEIVNNFLNLKNQINQTSPDAKIQIVDDIIVSTEEGKKPDFYVIEGNEIVPANAKEFVTQFHKEKVAEHSKEENTVSENDSLYVEENIIEEGSLEPKIDTSSSKALKPISKNPFKRFFDKIRGMFKKDKSENLEINTSKKTMEQIAKEFNARIHYDVKPLEKNKERTQYEHDIDKLNNYHNKDEDIR